MSAARTVHVLEDLGVSGCHIEDQVNPKRCGHLDGKEIVAVSDMRRRVRAAAEARRDPAFVICARTDARAVEGLDAAVERAKAYLDAGADMIFAEALADAAEIERFRKLVDAPLLVNMTEFGKTQLLDQATLAGLGVNVVIYPVTLLRLAMGAVGRALSVLASDGTQKELLDQMQISRPIVRPARLRRLHRSRRSAGPRLSAGTPEAKRGLAGVVADTTAVSVIDEATGVLLYRGYPVPELAASCSFEEVAYLIWYGELPTARPARRFTTAERSGREVPAELTGALAQLPLTCDPMDVLRTAVSYLGALEPLTGMAATAVDMPTSTRRPTCAGPSELWAQLPTIVAAEQRRRRGQAPIAPDPALSFVENFFHMCFGAVPRPGGGALL